MLNEVRIYRKNQKYLFLGQGQNELPRSKQRGINSLNLHSFRGKPPGIEPEEIEFVGSKAGSLQNRHDWHDRSRKR